MRSGVMQSNEKPIWYDVYKAFPPKRDPLYVKPYTRVIVKRPDLVPEIFYKEDKVRAKFYEKYGPSPRVFELIKSSHVSLSQKFVDKYTELQSQSELDETALFNETAKALLKQGILLRRRGAQPTVSAVSADAVEKLNIEDVWTEQQSASADSAETQHGDTQTDTSPSVDLNTSKTTE
ncbi:small ribosomal subunit protein mS23 isoform X2 [Cynoglossus semilaevis]|nr:28S ribosomal protein S23, mitochondrial isoform X2 [Cynoglossus semilaevis]